MLFLNELQNDYHVQDIHPFTRISYKNTDLDRSQSLFEFVPQEYYSQAGSTNLIKTISFPANCFVLAIDAPLPDGDKTELTKKLVSLVTIAQITLENYKLQITSL